MEVALERIEKCASAPGGCLALDLSNLGLNELPPLPDDDFPILYILYIQENNLTDISSLPSRLSTLFANKNNFSSMPPLPLNLKRAFFIDNHINILSCGLESLLYLNVDYNPGIIITELPPNLRDLHCRNCNIDTLPELPSRLETLMIQDNNLNHLPPLPDSLRYIFAENNDLREIPLLPEDILYADFKGNLHLPRLYQTTTSGPELRQMQINQIRKALYTGEPSVPEDVASLIMSYYTGGRKTRKRAPKRRRRQSRRRSFRSRVKHIMPN